MFDNTKKMVAAGFCASSIYNSINAGCSKKRTNNEKKDEDKPKYGPEYYQKLIENNFELTDIAKKDNYTGKIFYEYFVIYKKLGAMSAREYLKKFVDDSGFKCVFANRKVSNKVYKYIIIRGEEVKVEDSFIERDEPFANFAIQVSTDTNDIEVDLVVGDSAAPEVNDGSEKLKEFRIVNPQEKVGETQVNESL